MSTLIAALLLGQAFPNLDLSKGDLSHWDGKGFALAPANDRHKVGLWSKDEVNPSRKGMIRYVVTIPDGVRYLAFEAYGEVQGDAEPDQRLSVVLAGANGVPVPRRVKQSDSRWSAAPLILLPRLGAPRTYAWDVGSLAGQLMQIVLIDHDERPGFYLFAGNFRFLANGAVEHHDTRFGEFMLDLQKKHHLAPMAKFDSKRFTAISNASEEFTTLRLRNCEVFHDLFLNHFRQKGFAVHEPTERLMLAVFDNHAGFDAYFGQRMPSGIVGIYHTPTNRLVIYDIAENRAVLARKDAVAKQGQGIANPFAKSKFIETAERKMGDFAKDANLSTTMHECAHQISFNCGLLGRKGDVSAWLAEGLATYCESTDQGDWTSLGGINPMRITDLHRAQGQFIPLAKLLRDDRWVGSPQVLVGYAQSWALFHLLITQEPRALQTYLRMIQSRQTPESRLADFAECFGSFQAFDLRYQEYLRVMMARHRPTKAR